MKMFKAIGCVGLDFFDWCVFMYHCTLFLRCGGKAVKIFQGLHMSGFAVKQAANIGVGVDMGAQCIPVIKAGEAIIATRLPLTLHLVKLCHLALMIGSIDIAESQVTINFIFGHPVPDQINSCHTAVPGNLGILLG